MYKYIPNNYKAFELGFNKKHAHSSKIRSNYGSLRPYACNAREKTLAANMASSSSGNTFWHFLNITKLFFKFKVFLTKDPC